MYSADVTLGEIERRSEATQGWALLAKNARYGIALPFLMGCASYSLRGLIKTLTPERLEQLSAEDARSLRKRLQDLHRLLASFSRVQDGGRSRPVVISAPLVRRIQESTEDLADIIEDLVLADNDEFKELVSGCVAHITAAQSGRV